MNTRHTSFLIFSLLLTPLFATIFGTLAGLAAHWPPARLVGIWNNLPGATPVKKFRDRATAVSRIWNAIQRLGETVLAEPAARLPERVPATDTPLAAEAAPEPEATPAAPVAPQTPGVAPEARPAKTGASRAKTPVTATKKGFREGSRTGTILGLLNRPGGLVPVVDCGNEPTLRVGGPVV